MRYHKKHMHNTITFVTCNNYFFEVLKIQRLYFICEVDVTFLHDSDHLELLKLIHFYHTMQLC